MERRGGGRGTWVLVSLISVTLLFAVLQPLLAPTEAQAQENARNRSTASGTFEAAPLPPGWGAVVLGVPSGAELIERADAPPPVPEETEAAELDPAEFELSSAADFELVVQPGQVLSVIAKLYYGSARPELVEKLAQYNDLGNADALRAGDTLQLPSERRLLAFEP